MSAACEVIMSGSVAADITRVSEKYLEEHGLLFTGRRKLRMIYVSFWSSGKRGGFYSFADIIAVTLYDDNFGF